MNTHPLQNCEGGIDEGVDLSERFAPKIPRAGAVIAVISLIIGGIATYAIVSGVDSLVVRLTGHPHHTLRAP